MVVSRDPSSPYTAATVSPTLKSRDLQAEQQGNHRLTASATTFMKHSNQAVLHGVRGQTHLHRR